MLTKEEHAALLRSLAVDRLLQLVTLEAQRRHDGHVTIFALTTHYQVVFGPPTLSPSSAGGAAAPRAERPSSPTLTEALMVTCPSCRRCASRVTNCRSRSTAKLPNSAACSSFVST